MQIKLSFMGAARNVTGSCYLLEVNNKRFLIDCGMYQERDLKHRNWEPFPFNPGDIDAVILTHAHLDHCGLLPKLVRDGFRGKIYCTAATAEIAEIMLLDSARIQQEDVSYKKKRHEREQRQGPHPEVPLYTVDDAERVFPLFSSVQYGVPVQIGDVSAVFSDAGHVLGSAMVQVIIRRDGEEKRIIFSGDVGRWNKPILRDPTIFDSTDYIQVESTYGDKLHESMADISRRLAEVVNSTVRIGGNVVVPSFALERAQEIMYYLNELLMNRSIPNIDVYLDSPTALNVTTVFGHHPDLYDNEMAKLVRTNHSPFEFSGLKMVTSVDESKAINNITKPIMVIAGSGMCTGGRIKHHLVHNILRPESTILFVGYQAQDTLGRQIVEGSKTVRILGQEYPVRARIEQINGFSAHADRDELFRWLSGLKKPPRHLFITHGEAEVSQHFGEFIRDKVGWETSVPEYGTEVNLL